MNPTLPGHIPTGLVREFDHHRDPAISVDPFAAFERFREERIFWTPAFGGFWVLTRFADIRPVLHNTAMFSSRQSAIPAVGWARPFVPAELDPPEHGKYRALLVRWLALTRADVDGRPLTGQEMLDLAFLMAVASLDTLTQSVNFSFRYLAEHPGHQRRLAADPVVADHAAEELLRLHSVVSVARTATCDTRLAGAHIRKGDRILLCLALAGRDPDAYPTPATADFDRPDHSRHLAFGAGPHRCLGARIATRVLATALREWHRRIPAYAIPGHAVLRTGGGTVCSLTALPLTWSASPKDANRVGQMRPTGR